MIVTVLNILKKLCCCFKSTHIDEESIPFMSLSESSLVSSSESSSVSSSVELPEQQTIVYNSGISDGFPPSSLFYSRIIEEVSDSEIEEVDSDSEDSLCYSSSSNDDITNIDDQKKCSQTYYYDAKMN